MENKSNFKHVLSSDNYRTLSFLDEKNYPVNYFRKVSEKNMSNLLKIFVKSGMDLNEINQTIEKAIKGEKNELSPLILKSNQGDDVTNKDIILPFLIGVLSIFSIINLII